MTSPTDIDAALREIEEREKAATVGPWRWNEHRDAIESATAIETPDYFEAQTRPVKIIETDSRVYPPNDGDAAFIIAARTDVPRLVAALRETVKVVRRMAECISNIEYESEGPERFYQPVEARILALLKGEA